MADKKRQVFFSFHYKNDCRRAAQIRSIGVIEGNAPISDNDWEKLKNTSDETVKNWIKKEMKMRSCVIVLVGNETASRKWIKYEIEEAWNSGKGLLGIYIHNIKDPQTGKCNKGSNPFEQFKVGEKKLSDIVECYNPDSKEAYNDIVDKISDLIEKAIEIRNNYGTCETYLESVDYFPY